uniref:TTI1 C-terminal TPR domain-containing protein n=1 Tax=Meloidogyne hapla TaxID=6305 RepID=A0A1I8BSN5_MELHA
MLTDLENYLIELTKPSIENTDLEEQKVKGMLKRHEIDKLENLIFTILESKQLKQEFFKTTFRPALGHLLSLLLDTFGCSKMDIEIRRKCAFLICEITHIKHKELSTNFIAFVLPGIFIRIKRVIIQQIHSIEIVQFSSKILSNILIIAFSPLFKQNFIENKLISAPSIITFERNIEWINMAKEKIFPQFCLILTNLASSKIDSIRFEAVRLISVIFADKGEFCGDDFNKISIDICFLLFNDEQIRISDECQHLFTKLQSENANLVETYLINKLIASLKSLEKDVINAANGQIPLQNDRGDLLYETLKYCSSSNICVREAADNCLNKLVENSTQYEDVSEAIFENAHLLMFKILMAAQDFQANPRFPMVLSEMILRCSNPKIYFKLRGALDELLFWLDFSNQQQTLLLLFSLKNYCKALFNWFYPLIPQIIDEQQPSTSYKANEEDSDDEEINKKLLEEGNNQNDLNYPLIQNSVTILKRTKHFISSQYLPVQLNILDILKYSLELVKNYENELLPMIHQNWHGLIQKFGNEVEENAKFQNVQLSDSEMLVAIKSVDVIKTISSISKDFVYWKIVKEYLPRICALLEGLYKQTIKTTKIVVVKESVIKHSVAFKLQLALVESIPSIIENSDAFKNNNNLQRLKEILLLYSNLEDKNLEVLTNTARESLKRLEELEEEKRREN